jgi:hypothetical protein
MCRLPHRILSDTQRSVSCKCGPLWQTMQGGLLTLFQPSHVSLFQLPAREGPPRRAAHLGHGTNTTVACHRTCFWHDRDLLAARVHSTHLPVSRLTLERSCDSINILSSLLQLVLASCREPGSTYNTASGLARLSLPSAGVRLGRQASRKHLTRRPITSYHPVPASPDRIRCLTPSRRSSLLFRMGRYSPFLADRPAFSPAAVSVSSDRRAGCAAADGICRTTAQFARHPQLPGRPDAAGDQLRGQGENCHKTPCGQVLSSAC